jgi:hypothetical protein
MGKQAEFMKTKQKLLSTTTFGGNFTFFLQKISLGGFGPTQNPTR